MHHGLLGVLCSILVGGLAPLQAPQSAHREDEGEHRSHAERVQRPDEQESWAGPGDLAAKNASRLIR